MQGGIGKMLAKIGGQAYDLPIYMNSGDWIENLTSLEYQDGKWSIYKYKKSDFIKTDK